MSLRSTPQALFFALISAVVVGGSVVLVLNAMGDDAPPDEIDDSAPSAAPADDGDRTGETVDFMEPSGDHQVSPPGDITLGPATQLTAFFPAQANLQWLSEDVDYDHPVAGEGSKTNHPGGALSQGCAECHATDGVAPEPRELGERLVDTPAGVDGKAPYVDVDMRAAFDDEYLYLQTSWQSQRPRPGITHQTFQFLDDQWQRDSLEKTAERNQPQHLDDNELFDYEDRMAIQIAPEGQDIRAFGDEGPTFDEVGCAVGCHASMRNMPERPEAGDVQAHPYLGDDGLGRDDIRHYLLHTRDDDEHYRPDGAWANIDGDYDAAADRRADNYLDLWQYRGARSAPMYGASNDYIMEYRHSGEGGHNYWFNQDPSQQPDDAQDLVYDADEHRWTDDDGDPVDASDYAWMYDSAETGFHALPDAAIDGDNREISAQWAARYPLITQGPDRNAIPLDQQLIDDSEMLPRRVLRYATETRGRTQAFSRWEPMTNTYTVMFRRALGGAESDLDLGAIAEGHNLTAGAAIFDDHSSNRYHHITFPITIGTGDDADVTARDLRQEL